MKRIDLAGIAGNASVSVSSAGMTVGTTGLLTPAETPAPSTVYVLDAAAPRACTPLSVTASGGGNGFAFGWGFVPGVLSNFTLVSGVTGDKVILSGLDHYTTYAPAMYAEAEVEFRRITDGQMIHVGTARMTDVRFPLRSLLPSGAAQALSGTTFRHRLDSWNRRGVSYWYAVSAVGTDGKMGTRSAWASYTAQAGSDSGITVPSPETVTIPTRAEGGSLVAPANLTLTAVGNSTVDLAWSAVPEAAGYVVWLGYSDPATWPDTVGEFRLQDLQGGMPQPGDMIIWRKEVTHVTVEMFCARVHGASSAYSGLYPSFIQNALSSDTSPASWEILSWEEGEKPSEDLGRYYLRRTVPAGTRAVDGIYWSGGTGQTYYHQKKQGEVFVVDVWIRASAPATLRFNSGQPGETGQDFAVGTEWQKYHLTSDFAPESGGTAAYRWALATTIGETDLTVEYAQLRPHLEGSDYGTLPTEFSQCLLPGQKIRDHSLIKTRPATYTAKIVTNPPGEGYKGKTCGLHMDLCREHGAIPWVQLEWALFREDWLIWAEWLAQNYADDFDTIMLELGNENWNTLAAFWTLYAMKDAATGETVSAGAVYGAMTRMVYEWLQESPRWPDLQGKIELVIGGHIASGFGEQAYASCPEAKYVTVANYNGGWDTGTDKRDESGNSFSKMLGFAGGESKLVARETALATTAATLGKTIGTDVFHDIYEAGPGYQMNGLNGASLSAEETIVQECVVKSRAAATAQLDAICTAWKREWLSNWFVLGRGNYWTSHSNDYVEYLTHAVGRVIGDSMGEFRSHDIHPISMAAQEGIDDIAVHAFESLTHPGRWLLVALNRAIDRSVLDPADPLYDAGDSGLRPVTIHTGFPEATGCRVFHGGLGNMREHNRYPAGTRLTAAGTYAADPLCVDFDMDWHDVALPAEIGQLTIDQSLGAESGGLRGGNFILIELSGMVRA